MPSCKTVKTYERKSKNHPNNIAKSVDAFNALFAQNLTKRLIGRKRKPKIKLMELPPRTETYLTDSSVTFNAEETFDKIRKGKVYKEVKVVRNLNFDTSSSISFHSPIMTRKRLKQTSATISNAGSTKEILVQTNKSSTLDQPVTSSLLIEKEKKKLDFSSLSYIHLPKITENNVQQEMCNKNQEEWPREPIFSETFRERQTVHSSTPCVVAPFKKIVADSISPICKSGSPNSSKLIEKSYDEIRKWDSNFPILESKRTPKGPVLRSSTRQLGVCAKVRRRKSVTGSCGKMLHDWKLNIEPKVCLKSSDIIDFKVLNQKLDFQPKVFINCDVIADFKGFSEVEKLQSAKIVRDFFLLNRRVFQKSCKAKMMLPKVKQCFRKRVNNKCKVAKNCAGNLRSSPVSTNLSGVVGERFEKYTRKAKNSSTKIVKTRKRKYASSNVNNKMLKPRVKKKTSVPTEEFGNHTEETGLSNSTENCETNLKKIESYGTFVNKDKYFVTLRGHKVNIENNNHSVRNNTKETKKSMHFTNLTDDILSEREVSYSSISKCELDFGNANRVESVVTESIIDSSTDNSTLHLRVNQPKLNKSNLTEGQSNQDKSGRLTVQLQDFDKFEELSSARDTFDTTIDDLKRENFNQKTIISISDDDLYKKDSPDQDTLLSQSSINMNSKDNPITYSVEDLIHDQELCLPKLDVHQFSEDPVANSFLLEGIVNRPIKEKPQKISQNVEDELLQPSAQLQKNTDITPCKTPLRSSRSFDFIISSRNTSKKMEHNENCVRGTPKAKIIILSDISLGFCHEDTAKKCQDVYHDHSYSILPESPSIQYICNTPNNPSEKCSVQNNVSLMENQRKDSNFSLPDVIESSLLSSTNKTGENSEVVFKKPIEKFNRPKTITLRAGKTYRRSLSLLRRSSVFDDVLSTNVCPNDCLCAKCFFGGKLSRSTCRRSFQIVPASPKGTLASDSILETYARKCTGYEQEQDLIDTDLVDRPRNLSLISNSRNSLIHHCDSSLPVVNAKDIVLRRCGQTEVLPFEECYPRSILQNCQKIGEGVYGEVFLFRKQGGGTCVMKIIPIEGDLIVNGEKQKKFEEIVSEIVISMELSNLRNNKKNFTSCFTEVEKVRCTRGSYPDRLLDLWELYDETRGSENDSPQVFPPDQLYVVLELANGGQDLESYVFTNAMQVFAVFKQTACALAVAESQLKFEHRDLHWGNILVSSVDKNKTLHFRLNGKDIEIDTHGVEVSIIDFTLSRVEFDGVVIFNDLSHDEELFVAKGDYQFEIYRLMQQNNSNDWQHFEPYSNILWLHYLLDKAVTSALRYKNNRTKIHREYLGKLRKLKEHILSFHSVVEFVVNNFI